MLIAYERLSDQELRASAEKMIDRIEEWFKNNPKRRVCRANLWYGQRCSIKRKRVKEQIHEEVEKSLNT